MAMPTREQPGPPFMDYHNVAFPFAFSLGSCLQKVTQASPPTSCRMKHSGTLPTLRCLPHLERGIEMPKVPLRTARGSPKFKEETYLQKLQVTSLFSSTLQSTAAFAAGICKGHSPHFGFRTFLHQPMLRASCTVRHYFGSTLIHTHTHQLLLFFNKTSSPLTHPFSPGKSLDSFTWQRPRRQPPIPYDFTHSRKSLFLAHVATPFNRLLGHSSQQPHSFTGLHSEHYLGQFGT